MVTIEADKTNNFKVKQEEFVNNNKRGEKVKDGIEEYKKDKNKTKKKQ